MEPNTKKQKLEDQPALVLLDLNDDCIFQILWKLPKTDLCSMSFTCKRMQQLVFDHFPHQYTEERVTISNRGYIYFDIKEKLMKDNFTKCIPNVLIETFGSHVNLQHISDYVDAKCCPHFRELELDIEGLLKEVHVQSIRGRLQNLSTLIIASPHKRLDIHNVLLKYCENLEDLRLTLYSSFDYFWMLNKYPTIKKLTIELMAEEPTKLFNASATKFFELNPQIKSIRCVGIECQKEWNLSIKTVLLNVMNIERLDLIPAHRNIITNWIPIINQLVCYTKPNPIEWLHLRIGIQTKDDVCSALAELNTVQPVSELEYYFNGWPNELRMISQLTSVRRLNLECSYDYVIGEELLNTLSKQLPNLQELELCLGDHIINFNWITMQFIRNSFKMKNLTLTSCRPNTLIYHPNDLIELNECRSLISGASAVVIQCEYVEDFERPTFKCPSVKSLVIVKFKKTIYRYREVRG